MCRGARWTRKRVKHHCTLTVFVRAWEGVQRTRFAIKPGCTRSVAMLSALDERNCIACAAMHTTLSSEFFKYVTRPETQPALMRCERKQSETRRLSDRADGAGSKANCDRHGG